MRVVDIRQVTVPISRYADPQIPSGGLDTSAAAVVTDVVRGGVPVVGFGFGSFGRFGQGGLIRERFAPRLLNASDSELESPDGTYIDPLRAWDCMMQNEKPGGHGERCVAVGTLDMALWDAAAKIMEKPLYRFLSDRLCTNSALIKVPVYASGGYYYPVNDVDRLTDEVRRFIDEGYTHVKVKIGAKSIEEDLKRLEAVLALLPDPSHLAVDAMNRYSRDAAMRAAKALAPYNLRWLEDLCDPLDFEAQSRIASEYGPPIAVGEALFSSADAGNLVRYGGIRPNHDVFVFDPVHCYGVPEYNRILGVMQEGKSPLRAFQPHGGHLFGLHVAAALGLGGCESNPHAFQPFGGFCDGVMVREGVVSPPETPGIGIETRSSLYRIFRSLLDRT